MLQIVPTVWVVLSDVAAVCLLSTSAARCASCRDYVAPPSRPYGTS